MGLACVGGIANCLVASLVDTYVTCYVVYPTYPPTSSERSI